MFEQIPCSPVDPIFKSDGGTARRTRAAIKLIWASVITHRTGHHPGDGCRKQAEQWLYQHQHSKAYSGPAGRHTFNQALTRLLLPAQADSPQLATLQTPGGTGALRVAGDLINHTHRGGTLWLSDPPWVTHRAIFPAAGLQLRSYRYLTPTGTELDFSALLADLSQLKRGDTVLLQVAGP